MASGGFRVADRSTVEETCLKIGARERAGSRQTSASRMPLAWRSTTAVKSGPSIEITAANRCSAKWKSSTGSSTSARRVSRFQAR